MSLQRSKMLGSSCTSRGRMVLATWITWKLLWSRISPASWKLCSYHQHKPWVSKRPCMKMWTWPLTWKPLSILSIDASLSRDSNNQESAHSPKPQKINVSPYLTMSDWDIIKNSQRPINRIPTSFAITTRLTIKHEASKGLIIHICFPSLPIPQCQPYQWLHYFAWKSGLKNLMPGS